MPVIEMQQYDGDNRYDLAKWNLMIAHVSPHRTDGGSVCQIVEYHIAEETFLITGVPEIPSINMGVLC